MDDLASLLLALAVAAAGMFGSPLTGSPPATGSDSEIHLLDRSFK